jgi:dihydroorotate dehydrogenase
MITFSNGHSFEFMTASGALAFDGRGWPWEWPLRWAGWLDPTLFTVVTKTLTRHPRRGNLRWSHPWSVVKRIGRDGVLNAIGLTNKGIDWWLRKVALRIPSEYKIVVSIEADHQTEMVEMIQLLNGQKIVGIELNLSCPNSPSKDARTTERVLSLCHAAAKISSFPLIAKLSYTHDYIRIVSELEKMNLFEAVSINSIPWQALFPERISPLAGFGGGGVSGKKIQPFTWKMIAEISQASRIPVIGPSIWDYGDIQKVFDRGAKAVSFGSIFVHHPWRPTSFVRRWTKRLVSLLLISMSLTLLTISGSPSCSRGEEQGSGGGNGGNDSEPINTNLFQPGPVKDQFPTIAGVDFSSLLTMPDPSFPVSGNTLYVSTTGDNANSGTENAPLRSIVAAVNRSVGGGKVVVRGGTYAEGDPESGKGISINKSDLVITNASGEKVVVTPAAGFTYGINITGDNVILNGINVSNFSTVGIELGGDGTPLNNVILSNLTVEAVAEGIVNYEGLSPSLNKLLLENVVISGATLLGFSCNVGPCINVRFNNVAVHNRGTAGGNSGADCIAFENGDNLVFFNVEADHCEADGLDLKASRVAVYNSYFHNVIRNGLKLWKGGDVVNTIVSHTGGDASIVFDGPGTYRMMHSIDAHHLEGAAGAYTMTIGYDTTCGVSDAACGSSSGAPNCCRTTNLPTNFGGLFNIELTNNIFWHDSGPLFVPTGSGLSVRNNLFTSFADGEEVFDVRDLGMRIPVTGIQSHGWGSGNLVYGTNPNFSNPDVSPSAENLMNWIPAAGSPLINAGIVPNPTTYPSFDIRGSSRNAGGAPDIGPFKNQ